MAETLKEQAAQAEKKVRARAKKVKDDVAKAEEALEAGVKKTTRRAKTAAAKVEVAVEEVKAAAETEVKKTARKARAAKAPKLNIVIQSPMGGNITAEEIAAKLPEGAESVFVRVDHNKLYWIRGEETGEVDIW